VKSCWYILPCSNQPPVNTPPPPSTPPVKAPHLQEDPVDVAPDHAAVEVPEGIEHPRLLVVGQVLDGQVVAQGVAGLSWFFYGGGGFAVGPWVDGCWWGNGDQLLGAKVWRCGLGSSLHRVRTQHTAHSTRHAPTCSSAPSSPPPPSMSCSIWLYSLIAAWGAGLSAMSWQVGLVWFGLVGWVGLEWLVWFEELSQSILASFQQTVDR
jgi:hypothetical protein